MIWKTTLAKIFLPIKNVKNSFHNSDQWENLKSTSRFGILMSFFLTASFAVNAQNNLSSVSGDNCITFDSCPGDQTVCADTYENGVFGANVSWTDPVVTQSCTPNGRPGNFQMLFELNEQLLTVDCWKFNYISRVGSNGGQIKLFSGEDKDRSKKSVIVTPFLILKPGSETSIDVDYVNGNYTVQLYLVDENNNEIAMSTPPKTVDGSNLTYTFFTPNTVTGVYRLKYVFEYSGKEPSNANNGDTLIAVDGLLSDNGNCTAGVDFTVTAPSQGFYPVGSHDLQYVATYTAPDGTLKTKTCNFTITVTELDLQITGVNPVNCDGTGGSFTAVGTGLNGSGTPPYSYSVDGNSFQSSGNFNDLAAGPYTVTVKDATGCTAQANVTVGQLSPVTADISGNQELTCANTSITLDASGSTVQGPVSYLWNTGETTPSINVTATGDYSVTVNDTNSGCSDIASVTVTENKTPAVAAITENEPLTCAVTSVTLDASTSTADGNFTYLWSNGSTNSSISVTQPNTYSVTITGENGCEDTATVTVTENLTPAVAAITGNEPLTCAVTSLTLDASTSTADGNFTYLWSNGSTNSSISVTEPNTYSVTITGENGCEDTATVTVDENLTPAVAAITGNEPLTCAVTSVTLDASTSTADGNFTYLWSNGSTNSSISVTEAGPYSVTITGENGCEDTATVTVDENLTPAVAAITGNEPLTCAVTSVTLDASTSTADGNFTYLWSNGSTNSSISVTEAGPYSVTITGKNGCEDTATVNVTENLTPAVAAITGNEPLTCAVTSVTLDASTSTADGNFTYLWSNGSTNSSISVTEAGPYSVTITGENGCEDTATVTVTENLTPAVAAITGNETLTCAVTSVTLDASTSTADGNFTYEWSNGSTNSSISITEPNTYSVTITGENGCEDTATVTVDENLTPAVAAITGNETLTCDVTTATLDASTSTADGNFTYLWNNGSTDPSITVSEVGPYSVTITGENGCKDTASVTVMENSKTSQAVITGNELLTCTTTSVTLDASTSTSDGTFTYLWSTGSTASSITVSQAGQYSVTITGENGCKDTSTVSVDENLTPAVATITGNETITCDVTSITLDGSTSTADGNFTYQWSNGSTDPSITVSDAGTYILTITGENGCTDETSVTIKAFKEKPATPELAGTPDQPTCSEPTGSFEVMPLEGLEYSLNGGDFTTSVSFTDLTPETYSVVARNEYGCISDPLSVKIEPQPETPTAPIIHVTVQPSCGETTGAFGICCDTGLEYSIDGENFQREPYFKDVKPGDYLVVARNSDGCISLPASVTINPAPETPAAPVLASTTQPDCENPTGSFSVTAVTGMEYSIDGTNYNTDGVFSNLTADTTYDVVAKNAEGCISEATSVTIDPQPETPAAPVVASTTQPDCETATGSFSVTVETGLEYSIDGTNFNTDGIFSDLIADTTYNVVARNDDGCISEATPVTIEAQPETPAKPAVNTPTQPTCAVATGSFTVVTVAGMEYSIDGTNYNTDGVFSNLTADTTYEVLARNADGCISEATSVTIDPQPETPSAPEVASTTQPDCENPTGSFSVITENGLEYSIDGTTFITSGEFFDLTADVYNVVARNSDGCISASTPVTIVAQPGTPDAPEVSATSQPDCDVPTGSFSVVTEAGLEYSIDGTNYFSEGTFSDLTGGTTYYVTARNENGCLSASTPVSINTQPETPATPEIEEFIDATCAEPTGMIVLVYEDGISYTLTDEGGNVISDDDADGIFNNVAPGVYNVTAENSAGCTSPAKEVTISTPQIATIETATRNICVEDDPFDLSQLLLGEYDTSGTWEDPANTGALTNGTIDPSLLEVDQYTFNYVLTDGECTSTTEVTVNINDDCVVLACGIEDVKASISKAVTPNGDRINDYFTIGLDLDCGFVYAVKIFNRWGNKVYESNNYQNNWDGTSRTSVTGDQLPSGTYYYIVEISGLEPVQGYIYLGTK